MTGITYGVPSGVAATPNVSFGYDAAGNRTSMTDGLGSVSYVYNTISQLTSETRTFTGVAGTYALTYGYNLGGELNSVTNQWGAQVGYTYDKTGRPSAVTGSGYAGVSSYINSFAYRAFGLKQMSYSNGRTLSVQYDNRMRPTQWNIPGVLGWNYNYTYFGENTGRLIYAQNINDSTLDRGYDYDQVGRLYVAHSGGEARYMFGLGSNVADGPYSHIYHYDQFGNVTQRDGWGGENASFSSITYTNNRRPGVTYDLAGNVTNDGIQTFTYDATGQQATASSGSLQQFYDGNGLRGKKVDNGLTTYYLRSSVLGGQVVAEMSSAGAMQRGYVYLGGDLLAVQQSNAVSWVHQDPLVKSKRVTNSSGTVISTIELDPWGGNTNRSSNDAFQPHKFTTYERDSNGSDDAMFRRYNRWWSRFDQPDPYDGSYDIANPQSFNRYSYVQNDPINSVDPTGLDPDGPEDPPTTRHIDPVTGEPVDVPGINAGVVTVQGENSGLGMFGADTAQPLAVIDPTSLNQSRNRNPLKPRAEKQVDPQEEKCNQLRAALYAKAGKLLEELRAYDPSLDGKGGPTWKPGGHFIEITELQHGIKMDLKRYIEECIKNKGGPSGPSIPDWIDDAANREIPLPRFLPFYRPRQESKSLWPDIVPAGGAALVLYLIISEGTRLFPPRNLIPVP